MLIRQTLQGNPAVHFSIGEGFGFSFRSHELARYLVRYAERRNAVHIDSKGLGVIFFYLGHEEQRTWRDQADELRLLLLAIGPFRVWRVLRRKKRMDRFHAQFKRFVHCSYMAIPSSDRSLPLAWELRSMLFQYADELQLPVLAETTMIRHKNVYLRMGFEVYAQLEVASITTYLLCRYPKRTA